MNTLPRKQIVIAALATVAFLLLGAIVGLLIVSSGNESSDTVRELTLQPNDLPSEFVLTDEKLNSRAELLAELPAESQIAEAGVQAAAHVSYELQGDASMVIDVFVYVYRDEDAAETAHSYLRGAEPERLLRNHLVHRFNEGAEPHRMTLSGEAGEGMGDDSFSMTGEMEPDAESSLPVNAYIMRSGAARAEVLVAGLSQLIEDPQTVARNQFLRLARPDAVAP